MAANRRPAADREVVTIDGHDIALTNLDKVMYPGSGTTKGQIIEYYRAVAHVLIPHTAGRPATRKRWVHGTGQAPFFQKNLDATTPEWVERRTVKHRDHDADYPLLDDEATLVWLAQTASLEIHVPQWRFAVDGTPGNPDRIVFDLDPGPGAGLPECVQVAHWVREILEGMHLEPSPVTSGSKGIHLYAQLDATSSSADVDAMAHELAKALAADHPDLVVSDQKKTLRKGKVLVDWSQNSGAKTTLAPYSLRGLDRAFVAAPRTWAELDDPGLRQLEAHEVLARVREGVDPLSALDVARSGARGRTGKASAEPDADDPDPAHVDLLSPYRAKRDAAKTPEPVPGFVATARTDAAPTYVVQEHHARRLHWDFRLERDGVLVSWAVPKGVPENPKQNHLAVHVEDHPLEYGGFEGVIPKGEYGAGRVSIWDRGTYRTHKWREDEVIVTLDSELERGVRTVALIRTQEEQWLIHLMDHEPDYLDVAPPTGPAVDDDVRWEPMLATLAEGTDEIEDGEWAFEMKWDGIRALAIVETDPKSVKLISRSGRDMTAQYPELAVLADHARGPAVFDAEILAFDGDGRPDFGLLQRRMNLKTAREVEAEMGKVKVDLVVFDILACQGHLVTKEPYSARRRRLASAISPGGPIHVPEAFEGDFDSALEASRSLALEGVMAKRVDSLYRMGRRSRDWLKFKHGKDIEVVVIGWRPSQTSRGGAASLLLAVPDDDGAGSLRYAGRVGTGFSERDRVRIAEELERHERKTPPVPDVPPSEARDARWTRADRVGEVSYMEWTADGRLRQPVWRGWRPDRT